ncbi:hypothetical protein [Moheibacter sp.]|uniref:hypothetical protein n=1 Tax=Moheibacter sp. TaxID=1965316 RepID=UPI003C759F03
MKTLLTVLITILSGILYAQSIPTKAKNLTSFVPENWKAIKMVHGDLNNDQKDDLVLIIEEDNPKNIIENDGMGSKFLNLNPRYLLIIFQTPNGFELKELNKTFIPKENNEESPCLMDPLVEGDIQINKGVLVLSLNYWLSCGSWSTGTDTYTFRFQKNEFELIGFDTFSFARNSGEIHEVSVNFSTRKMSITTGGNMFEDADESEEKTEWKTFKLDKLQNLKTLKFPLEWEFMGLYI